MSFLNRHSIQVLNIAGKRESSAPGIGEFVKRFLSTAFTDAMQPPIDSD
ncbi:putative molybdenum carrier protein [Ralstonia sp. RL]|nr:putative molybdenum carrier protein [Ralstonia sp. RL]